jgi:nicotinate phosphoribosyltransferase
VFASEPIMTITGPLALCQILETPVLNLIGFATLVATNASRMVIAANGKSCVEFGIRRAQGPDGGLTASEYAYLGGFVGTSNVECGRLYGIPTIGTMSHAYITSFSGLEEAEEFEINGVRIK